MGSSGGRVEDNPPGTRVRVSGLNHDVMEDDIKELFSGVGELLHCEVRRSMIRRGPDLNVEGSTSQTLDDMQSVHGTDQKCTGIKDNSCNGPILNPVYFWCAVSVDHILSGACDIVSRSAAIMCIETGQ